ncbi:hypothetical protein Naga_100276g1 [Nannochloropsis gaditana]|uniref:Uncharacterized protein n=1 Tax=Nannochloropsis gaditana TaxID=72520 RepID=W7TV46_9STRA|nr:hypothetical protein Naga_100276g1 [Nannochloropsis gaditana]
MEDEGNPTLDPSPPQKLHRVPSLVLPEEAIFGTSTAAPCLECRDYHERHHKVTLQSPSQAGQVKSDGEHFSFLTGTGREGEADKTPRTEESGSEEAPKLLLSQSLLAPS